MLVARKRKLTIVAAMAMGTVAGLAYYGLQFADIATAYVAKTVCSGILVSGRTLPSVLESDVAADDLSFLSHVDVRVERDEQTVSATLFGHFKRQAAFRSGQGCVLIYKPLSSPNTDSSGSSVPARVLPDEDEFAAMVPTSSPAGPNRLEAVLDQAFAEPSAELPRRTRAVLVLSQGRIIAERYAEGFGQDTPLIGWSMTKSVFNALVGVLVEQGRLSLDARTALPEWQAPEDPRQKITWGQLLQMSSGLRFSEQYADPRADAIRMLLAEPSAAAYALAKPLADEPGTRWNYSSGTTNILSYLIRNILGEAEYRRFPRSALFDRIGMRSAVLESDASGTYVGSSFMYATARDWARLGLLFLWDGVWSGERILPEGWVAYTRTPAPRAPEGQYGAHFWLRVPEQYRCDTDTPDLPFDAFHAVGHEGQFVTVIPSRDLVVVRLGLTRRPCAWNHPAFVHSVIAALAIETSAPAAETYTTITSIPNEPPVRAPLSANLDAPRAGP